MVFPLLPDQTKYFGNWKEAQKLLSSLEGRYVFRGMGDADWDLLTTLNRKVQYRSLEAEKVLVDSFQKALPQHVTDAPPRSEHVSWRALMRHYGLPSRFLDCTESYAVAAYFATEPKIDREFAIWAIQKDEIQRFAETSLGILNRCAPPLSPLELANSSLFKAAFDSPKRFVALVDTTHKSRRQQAQQGLFLCPSDPAYPFWRNFDSDDIGFMCRVVLPSSARSEVGDYLRGSEINHANLLPDRDQLEKLCNTLAVLLGRTQEQYGHFQWMVEVKPLLMNRGLLEATLRGTDLDSRNGEGENL